MLSTEQQGEEERKDCIKACLSVESTGDEQETPFEHKVAALEQQHRALSNYYMAKIKQMGEVIHRQAKIKEELNKQLHSLAELSQSQQTRVATLAAEFNNTQERKPHKQRLDLVASAYLIPKMTQKPQKSNINGKGVLFTSEKLKTQRLKVCKSQSSRDGDYFPFKSPDNLRRKLKLGSRQSQRVQI